MPEKIDRLEGDVDGARGNRHPLCPGTDIPQAVGLHESQGHVDNRHYGDFSQANVADPVHQGDEDPKEMVVVMGTNVKKFQEALGQSPDIFVPHGKHTQARKNDQYPFRKLNGSDGAHAFDVSGIMDSVRMHVEGAD